MSLQDKLETVQSLHSRLSLIRKLPLVLLNPSATTTLSVRDTFNLLDQLQSDLLRPETQLALEATHNSTFVTGNLFAEQEAKHKYVSPGR